MNPEERKELDDLRAIEKGQGNLMSEAEKAEYERESERLQSKASFLSAEDQQRYAKAKDVFDENNAKIKSWITKNPDATGEAFQDHNKAVDKLKKDGKPIPLTFAPGAVKQMQQSILTAMAEGFSPQNAKSLLDAIGKKNNLKYFREAMGTMDGKTAEQVRGFARQNEQLKKWIEKSTATNVVDLNDMFRIKEVKTQKKEDEEEA
jgi:hypothetical protein